MKNSQKVIIVSIVCLVIVGLIVAWSMRRDDKAQSVVLGTEQSQATSQSLEQDIQAKKFNTVKTSDFGITYSTNDFAQVTLNQTLPPQYTTKYAGIKLIAASRIALMGKNQCMYGESGITTTCSADKEAGISFIVVADSVKNLTAGLEASLKQNVFVAGKQAVLWRIGAEKTGFDYYYVPVTPNKTLVITGLYRDEGFPSQTLFSTILRTLVIQ